MLGVRGMTAALCLQAGNTWGAQRRTGFGSRTQPKKMRCSAQKEQGGRI